MAEIALYNTLRKIPEVSDAEAKEAVADIASSKEVATKADIAELKAETKTAIAELEARITWKLVIVLGIYTAIISFVTQAL